MNNRIRAAKPLFGIVIPDAGPIRDVILDGKPNQKEGCIMEIMQWIFPILRTWAHILVGLGAMLFGFICLGSLVKWIRGFNRENDINRKLEQAAIRRKREA